jgi:hypothetical protein
VGFLMVPYILRARYIFDVNAQNCFYMLSEHCGQLSILFEFSWFYTNWLHF